MSPISVLVFSVEPRLLETCRDGLDTSTAVFVQSCTDAKETLANRVPDVVVSDLTAPKADGMKILHHVKQQYPTIPVIVIAKEADSVSLKNAVNCGADDFLTTEFTAESLALRVQMVHDRAKRASDLDKLLDLPMLNAKRDFVTIYIIDLMKRYKGRITAAARASGINRRTIHRVLSENDISPRRFRTPKA